MPAPIRITASKINPPRIRISFQYAPLKIEIPLLLPDDGADVPPPPPANSDDELEPLPDDVEPPPMLTVGCPCELVGTPPGVVLLGEKLPLLKEGMPDDVKSLVMGLL